MVCGVRPLRRELDRPWEDFQSSNSFSALEGPTVKGRPLIFMFFFEYVARKRGGGTSKEGRRGWTNTTLANIF